MWLNQISIYNDLKLKVIVLSESLEPDEVKILHKDYIFEWIQLVPKEKSKTPLTIRLRNKITRNIKAYQSERNKLKVLNHHNVRFKLFHLTKWPKPFIFLDVDAILFSTLSELVKASSSKPFIAINHQRIPKHTEGKEVYLNGGVQIVSQPGFFSFEDFTKQTDNLLCPGHEQALIYTYFNNIGYDYTHPEIDYKWNSCSGYNELIKVDGKWKCFSKGVNVLDSNLESETIPAGIEIKINHYWDEFKPWKIDCPMYKEFESNS